MYNSKYYTCEQIDQRLLQGYVDDYNLHNGTTLTQREFLDLLSIHLKTGLTLLSIVHSLGDSDTKVVSQKALTEALRAIEAGGVIWAQELGDSPTSGISQKALTELINSINSHIAEESSLRVSSDGELRELIDQEVSNRQAADTELENRVNQKIESELPNVVQVFGYSTTDTISQAAITREIQNIHAKLVEITGEQGHGMVLTITPDYFWEDTANITINATVEASVFDSLLIYANGELITQATNTNNFTFQHEITGDTVIKAVGTVLGITYTREHSITKVAGNLVVGAGQTYDQVLSSGVTIPYTNAGDHNVQVNVANDGDYIFVLLAATSTSQIHHILMSSLLVPTEVINTDQWIIYKSLNQYKANNYLICIN